MSFSPVLQFDLIMLAAMIGFLGFAVIWELDRIRERLEAI
jgi:hypothetical protein